MKLFHQCGHCTKWNLEAYDDDSCGDGLILSPVHEKRARLEGFKPSVLRSSHFDPQYYLPNSQKAKLHSYNFFPEVVAGTGGFNTVDFSLVALRSAQLCIAFQSELGTDRIVIPARFFAQMDTSYTTKQASYTVVPFLKEIARQKVKKPVYLTVPLTSHMIEDEAYRTNILNWVTSFPEIDGIYLIPSHDRPTKQIVSTNYLTAMLNMLTEIREADLRITVGYSNNESLLYTLVGDVDITMGAYENTRIFSLDKFVESDEDRRGPKARIYLPGLLNWIQYSQAKDIYNQNDEIWGKAYVPTDYGNAALNRATEPHFNQPDLYRHYFQVFSAQVDILRPLSRVDRYKTLRKWIRDAQALNQEIEDIPIDFERHGRGDHLQPWLDCINKYYAAHLKE